MGLDILAFGVAKEIMGGTQVGMDCKTPLTIAELKVELGIRFPQLIALQSYAIAINGEYAEEHQMVNIGDEVAIIPPVSGG